MLTLTLMEFPVKVPTKRHSIISRVPIPSRVSFTLSSHAKRLCYKLGKRFAFLSANVNPLNLNTGCTDDTGDSDVIDVIGIGSRKDAVLDFCLDSPLQSHSQPLRFWNIVMKDTAIPLLQQRLLDRDSTPRTMEAEVFMQSHRKALILVASAGYGLDHTTAIDILRAMKSLNGFVTAIVLSPFSFEGQRRKNEVNDLVEKIKEHTYFFIDIDTDMLLKKDVTLDEALRTANNGVLLAINTIHNLMSDEHKKHFAMARNQMKEINSSEVTEVLQGHKQARIGFGTGCNIKTSIVQAIYECPFLSCGLKDFDGIVICMVTSSNVNENIDVDVLLQNFHQITGYKREVIVAVLNEPNLDDKLVLTTVVTVGSIRNQNVPQRNLLSSLAQHLPFVFNLLTKPHQQSNGGKSEISSSSLQSYKVNDNPDSCEMQSSLVKDDMAECFDVDSEVSEAFFNRNHDKIHELRSGQGFLDDASKFYNQAKEEALAFEREPFNTSSFGPGYEVARLWAKERENKSASTSMLEKLSTFDLPVGVRPSKESKDYVKNVEIEEDGGVKTQALINSSMSAVKGFYSVASTLLKGKSVEAHKKQGVLSVRASSMLESERNLLKKWSPVVEMRYRGGIYRGRCQGGLPEGKGRLVLADGSIYDGMWRYGKRSGSGTFYFSNGDVFQGSWRDDVMHGKGWFYFHTGDRWFASFWKGKANGEGRFYAKSGDILFGHFEDGWRHGHFLCIKVDGERYVEVWDQGVLTGRKQMESNL